MTEPEAFKAFFYGTLMHPGILRRVIRHAGRSLKVYPAILLEFTRHQVKFADYPGILPYSRSREMFIRELDREERSVRGTLITGLTNADMEHLDEFEGNEYIQEPVDVHPLAPFTNLSESPVLTVNPIPPASALAPPIRAKTYVWCAPTSNLKAELWSFDDFVKDNARYYTCTALAAVIALLLPSLMHPNGTHQHWFYAIIAIFLVFFFAVGVRDQIAHPLLQLFPYQHEFPDFSRYLAVRTLSEIEFPTFTDSRRVIVVGDIHGMDRAFHALLDKVSYNPQLDVLVHVGDTVSRGTHDGSMAVLSYMASNNITGVRGNHDQKVVEWRTWLDWISGQKGGLKWLAEKHRKWLAAERSGIDLESWIDHESTVDKSKWWKKIPEGWILFSDHFKIAYTMPRSDAHTFIVHAGLLASDPRREPTHPRQPLSHIPVLPSIFQHDRHNPKKTIGRLRRLQEMAILHDVPQNTDPWVVLNIRTIRRDNTVSRKNHGKTWPKLWNKDMSRCYGFEMLGKHDRTPLPCYPSTVLYGHAASRRLDVRRWSVGLDTGCVYNRRLTALILGPKPEPGHAPDARPRTDEELPYGDDSKAWIASVSC